MSSSPEEERARLLKARRTVFGSRLRQLRTARELSLEALASRARVDRSFLNEVELGQASPRLDWVYDVAAALGVHPGELFRDPRR